MVSEGIKRRSSGKTDGGTPGRKPKMNNKV
jgi:hypothetical protein